MSELWRGPRLWAGTEHPQVAAVAAPLHSGFCTPRLFCYHPSIKKSESVELGSHVSVNQHSHLRHPDWGQCLTLQCRYFHSVLLLFSQTHRFSELDVTARSSTGKVKPACSHPKNPQHRDPGPSAACSSPQGSRCLPQPSSPRRTNSALLLCSRSYRE